MNSGHLMCQLACPFHRWSCRVTEQGVAEMRSELEPVWSILHLHSSLWAAGALTDSQLLWAGLGLGFAQHGVTRVWHLQGHQSILG